MGKLPTFLKFGKFPLKKWENYQHFKSLGNFLKKKLENYQHFKSLVIFPFFLRKIPKLFGSEKSLGIFL